MSALRPAYRVTTPRLLMRPWSPEDAPLLRALLDRSDHHFRPYIPWMRDEPKPLAGTVAWCRGARARFDRDEEYRYAVLSPDGEALIGETGLFKRVGADGLEVGYFVDVDRIGRGYASEATSAMLRVAFDVERVDRVELHCVTEHAASRRIAEKLGFTCDGTIRRRAAQSDGTMADLMIWTLFADAYARTPARALTVAAFDCLGGRLL
ncbi:MAG TPA: GNAT family N-acetyltransferase [Vicinamibacterales bacterium]|nr:GNAT family N-acetyltransferase [Vicinamibacterales bacterium]